MADRAQRRIVFLSGTRADFGKIKSLIRALQDDPSRFDVHIFATGMHMEPRYGYTVEEIEKSGFTNVYRFINQAAYGVMDRSLAHTVLGFGDYVRLVRPDLIVVHGDRVEALAGALVGALNNVLVAHIEGGEISGTVDELVRHSVSKLSHLHFVANEEASRRLVQLGEDPQTIHVIGSPDVDVMSSPDLPPLEWVRDYYGIPFERFGLLVFHPVTTSIHTLQRETREVIAAALESDLGWVVVYPNSDSGSDVILAEYEARLAGHPRVRLFPSIRFEAMLVLLRHAAVIVGNSSMGIREAPYYGTPTVDVGSRQRGRSSNPDILHVSPERRAVRDAIRHALRRGRLEPAHGEWGSGDSHVRFRQVLERAEVYRTPVQKHFRDLPFIHFERDAA